MYFKRPQHNGGLLIAAFQLRIGYKVAQTEFEGSIDQLFRELTKRISVDALIGKAVPEDKKRDTRELIYNYLDLSNEHFFSERKKRIRKDTWIGWCAGIRKR